MSSLVRILGKFLVVDYIDAEGRILARTNGANAPYQCPLKLYSDGAGIPSDTESNRFLCEDPDAKWLGRVGGRSRALECAGCGKKMLATDVSARDLLRNWTIHKITCSGLKSSAYEAKDEDGSEEDSRKSVDGRRAANTAGDEDVSDNPESVTRPTIARHVRQLLKFQDVGSVCTKNYTVFCKPCDKTISLGYKFSPTNYTRHTTTARHLKRGGVPFVEEKRKTASSRRREARPLPAPPSHCVTIKNSRSPGVFKKRIRPAPSTRPTFNKATPSIQLPSSDVTHRATSLATEMGCESGPSQAEGGGTRLMEACTSAYTSGQRRVFLELTIPEGLPPMRVDFQGSVTF